MFLHATLDDSSVTWPNPPYSTFLFRNLLKNDRFANQFIDRYSELLNHDFSIEITVNKLDAFKALYKQEVPHHISRWHFPENYSKWESDLDQTLLSFLEKRPCGVEANIIKFFNLNDFGFNCSVDHGFEENKLILAPNPNNGYFFIYNSTSETLKGNVTIMDITGKVVYIENDISLEREVKRHFNLSHLSNNTYILSFENTSFTERMKIVVIK